jgi:hypothetical protein
VHSLSFAVYVGMIDPCLEDELRGVFISQAELLDSVQGQLTVGALKGYDSPNLTLILNVPPL